MYVISTLDISIFLKDEYFFQKFFLKVLIIKMDVRHGDCLGENGMRTLADKSIDFICCDLPYGVTEMKWDKPLD